MDWRRDKNGQYEIGKKSHEIIHFPDENILEDQKEMKLFVP